jgi:hypothetical protein
MPLELGLFLGAKRSAPESRSKELSDHESSDTGIRNSSRISWTDVVAHGGDTTRRVIRDWHSDAAPTIEIRAA